MSAALRGLLASCIDYAGLFPPAKLSLEEAMGLYPRYRQAPEAWMLGRFICPAARLAEAGHLLPQGPPWGISALGRGGENSATWLAGLDADLGDITSFNRDQHGRAAVEVLEVKLPADAVSAGVAVLSNLLRQMGERLRRAGLEALPVFCELPATGDWRKTVETTAAALEAQRPAPVGCKLRSGGLEAKAFPTPEQIACVIRGCLRHHVPLKATAGLHHPLPRWDAGVQARMHGFVNLFAAVVLARAHNLVETALASILNDDTGADFSFTEQGLRWRDLSAGLAAITEARREGILSFGSCSFEEPVADLRALGWL
jgi:hypothetical protein